MKMRKLTILVSYDEPECGGAADALVRLLFEEIGKYQKTEKWEVPIAIDAFPVFASAESKHDEDDQRFFTDPRSGKKKNLGDCGSHREVIAQVLKFTALGGVEEERLVVSPPSLHLEDQRKSLISDTSQVRHFVMVLVLLKDSNYEVYNAVRMMCTGPSYRSIVLFHKTLTHLSNYNDVGLLLHHVAQSVLLHVRRLAASE